MPSGNKPLPEPMLTQIHVTIHCGRGTPIVMDGHGFVLCSISDLETVLHNHKLQQLFRLHGITNRSTFGRKYSGVSLWYGRFSPRWDMWPFAEFRVFIVWRFKMMYLTLWDRRHEGATRIGQGPLTYPRGPECLRSHNALYITLKSYCDMYKLVLILCEAEICWRSSEGGDGESCIVGNVCMVLWVTCITTLLWRRNDSGVTKSTQNMDAYMCEWEILWKVSFVSINFNEINYISNTNPAQFYNK